MRRLILIIALSTNLCTMSYAICSEPIEPFCIKYDFDSSNDYELCKMKVKYYRDELIEYINCRDAEIVCKFNCKARHEDFCRC